MSYLKGKDIKVPFDCLWYYFTRKFETIISGDYVSVNGYDTNSFSGPRFYNKNGQVNRFWTEPKPTDFEKW